MGGFIIIGISICVLTLLNVHRTQRKPFKTWIKTDEYIIPGIISLVIGLFFSAILGVLTSAGEGRVVHGGDYSHCEEWNNTWPIASLGKETVNKSSFILGTGGSNVVDRYYVFREEEKGLLFTTYDAHKTYIVEQDDEPRYERIDYDCPMPFYDFMWFSSDNTHHNYGRYGTLYVPHNTVMQEYKL